MWPTGRYYRVRDKQWPRAQLAATGTAGQDLNSAKGDWQAATAQDATTQWHPNACASGNDR